MRVLHINSNYYSSTAHRELQLQQIKQGVDSQTFAPVSYGYIPRIECDYGYEGHVKKVECFNRSDRMLFHLKHRKILLQLRKQYVIRDFDLLHAHSLFINGYIAMKIKQEFDIPYVVIVRNTDIYTFFRKMVHLRNFGVSILKNASCIVFLSFPYKNEVFKKYVPLSLRKELDQKTVIIPNGISDYWFKHSDNSMRMIHKPLLRLLHIGDIDHNKNVLTTLILRVNSEIFINDLILRVKSFFVTRTGNSNEKRSDNSG